jgi:hypothetical protein
MQPEELKEAILQAIEDVHTQLEQSVRMLKDHARWVREMEFPTPELKAEALLFEEFIRIEEQYKRFHAHLRKGSRFFTKVWRRQLAQDLAGVDEELRRLGRDG